jgi:hypothetical protein
MLGLATADTWEMVRRAGLDSIPKLRGAVIRYLTEASDPADTTSVGAAVDHPSRSVRRALEDLTAHGVVTRILGARGMADQWMLSDQARTWLALVGTVPEMATRCTACGELLDPALVEAGFTDHGEETGPLAARRPK